MKLNTDNSRQSKSEERSCGSMINDKKMLTVKELAIYLCISESTVRKMVRESRIPVTRIFSKILFDKAVIDNWLIKNRCGV